MSLLVYLRMYCLSLCFVNSTKTDTGYAHLVLTRRFSLRADADSHVVGFNLCLFRQLNWSGGAGGGCGWVRWGPHCHVAEGARSRALIRLGRGDRH